MPQTQQQAQAWRFWQESHHALGQVYASMKWIEGLITQNFRSDEPLPQAHIDAVERNLAIFQEKFALLVREQQQGKAAR